MRKLLRSPIFKVQARSTLHEYKPEAEEVKIRNWVTQFGTIATKASSKVYLSQLNGLLQLYNKKIVDTTKPIDFDDWDKRIMTKGIVSKVQTSYEQLAKEEFELGRIFAELRAMKSEPIQKLKAETHYHTVLWTVNYIDYILYLNSLQTYPAAGDQSYRECRDFFRSSQVFADSMILTGNRCWGGKDDVNLLGYITSRMRWGRRVVTFYRHPSQDNKAGFGTVSALGR